MRVRLLLALPVVAIALTSAAFIRGGLPYEVHHASGQIAALGADGRSVYWLEGGEETEAGADSLWVLDRGRGSARRLLAQPGLRAVAGAGEALVVLQREDLAGKLLRVPRSGGDPTPLAEGLSHPVGLAVYEGEAYWTETEPRLVPGARQIPASQARVVLKAAPASGRGGARTVAWLWGGTREFEGEVLGGAQGRLYVLQVAARDCGGGWSYVRSVPAGGGPAELVVLERGPQTALLVGDGLYWTAPSEDAGKPMMACVLRSGRLPSPAPETLTDWLPAMGRLCEAGGRVYHGSSSGLWLIPERPELPAVVTDRTLAGGLVTSLGGAVYAASGTGGLLRCPRTPAARLAAGVRIR